MGTPRAHVSYWETKEGLAYGGEFLLAVPRCCLPRAMQTESLPDHAGQRGDQNGKRREESERMRTHQLIPQDKIVSS